MTDKNNQRTGGQLLVDCLLNQGAEIGYCVPGESYLGVLDALYDIPDELKLIICRQEGSVAFMAEAYGSLTGKPGLGFVTRGPGAANAVIGVQTAHLDGTPMILFVGQVPRKSRERGAFQELDLKGLFGSIAKLVMDIDDAARIPEIISRAYRTACSGRPGAVIIGLPDDMQRDLVSALPSKLVEPTLNAPGDLAMAKMQDIISEAKRPLVLLGAKPSTWNQQATDDLQKFVESHNLPLATVFRRQDQFDNGHPNYVGVKGVGNSPKLEKLVAGADTLIVIGAEMTDIETNGYTKYSIPDPEKRLIHIGVGHEDLGRVFQAELSISCDMTAFAAAASELSPLKSTPWSDWLKQGRLDYEEFSNDKGNMQQADLAGMIKWMDETLPDDTIVSFGAGNYTQWVQRYFSHNKYGTQLATQSAVMGYSVPAAISASLLYPEKTVLSFAGDGCFLMNGQELATAVKYKTNVRFIVINNSLYGSIMMHQERHFPNRSIAIELENPDFEKLAGAYGIPSAKVDSLDDFKQAFDKMRDHNGPCLIEIITEKEIVTPGITLTDLRS
ncbi:MAG: thiamine pyrophosphate-binding protein [Kordiimonadaceae bacterium]|jgi:acetolactate synthase I/II/III large subunit|nr:thiamine pyrophosphate-binding protein [Kordiimonadaceae bacterium]MBT6035003.1 thiamine pyrophosphate-binding protein [Kordiimonadaceae bacterium]MBT7582416.1 thiamine pyrophosphate-binding protein [Kordiimonadaceae bacterium]